MAHGRVVYFATGNVEKYVEVVEVFGAYPVTVVRVDAKGSEIQSDSVEKVAEASANNAARRTGLPTFVEDTGLFIQHLKGFPGPYAAYAYRTIGLRGILALMEDTSSREAYFRSVVAFATPRRKAITFVGEIAGRIASSMRGSSGFGYDPVFEPHDGGGRTFGEMSRFEKNRLSHRAMAVKEFAEWLCRDRGADVLE